MSPILPPELSSSSSHLPSGLSTRYLSAPSPSSRPSQISPAPISPCPLPLRAAVPTDPRPFSFRLPTLVLASPPPLPAVNLGLDRAIVLRASGPRRRRGRCERGHSGAFVCVPAAVNALLVNSCTKMAETAAPTQASPFGGSKVPAQGGTLPCLFGEPEAEDNAFISLPKLRVLEGWQGGQQDQRRPLHPSALAAPAVGLKQLCLPSLR